MIVKETLAKEL